MKVTDFTYLLEQPDKVVDPLQTKQLEDMLEEYPYFQAARALHLKGLKNLNSYKYNKALKVTAAFTTDREVLFDFITSRDFLKYDIPKTSKNIEEVKKPELPGLEKPLIEASEDKPLPQDKKDAEQILDPKLFRQKEEVKKLELGKPLVFDKKEKYSFTEWLQLTSKKPIARTSSKPSQKTGQSVPEKKDSIPDPIGRKEKKFERIDKFIAQNPKITIKENSNSSIDVSSSTKLDKNELMTATLARVYLEQKKYKKAIQAYKILSLKYPEKSGFFADRIKAVEKIQQENK
ncbi:hypothetical protein [Maribacter sp. 2304DJ31-5]|uniref:hypothetical protein n=1 Tax=Maribacter sp. 2304DJ31-5 TaxID=3386273 RepID=UPI0039BCBBC0